MNSLTSQLLDNFPYSKYADAKVIERGRTYFKENRVTDVAMHGSDKATCTVEGDSGEYTVDIEVSRNTGELYFGCDCPYAENYFCKHMVAAALELSAYLRATNHEGVTADYPDRGRSTKSLSTATPPSPSKSWRYKLDEAFSQAPRPPLAAGNLQRYAAVLLMVREDYYYTPVYSFKPRIIKAKNWYPLQGFTSEDAQAVDDLLEANRDWYKSSEDLYAQVNPAGCLNLSLEAFNLLTFFQQVSRFYSGSSFFVSYLPLLEQLRLPMFLLNSSKKSIQKRITILSQPADVEISFTREEGRLLLQAGLKGKQDLPEAQAVEVVSARPPWVLMGDRLMALRDANQLGFLSSFPISIPESDADFFRDNYLQQVAETFPIQSDLLHWRDIQAEAIPRLYLREDKDKALRASLRFGYDQYELAATKSDEAVKVETLPDSWDMLRIHRQPEREKTFYQLLANPLYRLKRAGLNYPYATFELRAHAHPFDFLMYSIPLLAQAGFEIYGEDQLKLGKINRTTPTLRLNLTSGIDWFDLKAVVEFGDQQVPFQDLRKAMKRGESYVKLADGSVGQIPSEWMEKYKHLWNLANETEDGYRLSDFHLPLIDSLLESDTAVQLPADFSERRDRFRSFERITPQPIPQGFTGELRPYQKHGFDWLYFLREYKVGGILADDMGLGKTIQVLAFMQSLRERGQLQKATLLVVPKSLIANWQRESERFTPELRILEYVGNLRVKDPVVFDGYDLVLTTYGTMLRDVELLRGYRFEYLILDESQAIKNPLTKSAKAARLLNGEHRIVMTGTPVENNTFELWSQFAFLNPGLLGSLDYFKREFANPIENEHDEAAAATLRKLVYPFILRRTKDQVAPELPPRTERIVYTDMDAGQKKIYTQARERYRAELLGLIDREGMNDARFKILEGLLRLRQIAIHPGLVDKAYKGEAPKFEFLFETLETLQAEGHKALIFSQFVETLKLVRRELDLRKIHYVYLDGKTQDRQARVDLFQNDPAFPFFLISLKAGGVGLNLTAADYVIHLDPWWNPAVEMQASDRAHRIGQDKPVFIYKIITRDTVEEKILQLQEKKRTLVKTLIATDAGFLKSLTKGDIESLFDS
jgi:non-specific serine/threonine protein kinase